MHAWVNTSNRPCRLLCSYTLQCLTGKVDNNNNKYLYFDPSYRFRCSGFKVTKMVNLPVSHACIDMPGWHSFKCLY